MWDILRRALAMVILGMVMIIMAARWFWCCRAAELLIVLSKAIEQIDFHA
jgi:hypothetical protein